MQRSTTTPDAFIASLPDEARHDIASLDADISVVMAGRERVLWEGVMWGGTQQAIIGYGSYQAVNRSGGHVDWFLVGLARQKRYLSLYMNAVENGTSLVQAYASRLGRVRVGSANVSARRAADIDRTALLAMITKARDLTDEAARRGTG